MFVSVKGVQGKAKSICALKGSSVYLPCSAQHHNSSTKWFTVHRNGSNLLLNELSADGNHHGKYNMSEESNYTLMIKDLTESDAKLYCCSESAEYTQVCSKSEVVLYVAGTVFVTNVLL